MTVGYRRKLWGRIERLQSELNRSNSTNEQIALRLTISALKNVIKKGRS